MIGLLFHRRLAHQDDDRILVRHRTAHPRDPPEVLLETLGPVRRVYHRLDPVFEENCGGVRVTIQRPRNIANLGAEVGDDFGDDNLTNNQKLSALDCQMKLDFGDDFGDEKQVYTVILASPEISQPQIAAITRISARTVSRVISRLKNFGYIRREGSDRKGSWICLK